MWRCSVHGHPKAGPRASVLRAACCRLTWASAEALALAACGVRVASGLGEALSPFDLLHVGSTLVYHEYSFCL